MRTPSVQVTIVHLPPEGMIGRHPAVSQQLLAVVAGSGWVSGSDSGVRRSIRAGYGALWEAGESHEAGTDVGLTAVSIQGTFEVQALTVTQRIVVAAYDPVWPEWFEQVRAQVWPAVADVALRIDHVGSTSVPGLAAKPIIDLDIVVASPEQVRPAIERLAGIGYRWRGDLGVTGREAFAPPPEPALPSHHLYLVAEDNKAHLDHWLLARPAALRRRRSAAVRKAQAGQRGTGRRRHRRVRGGQGCVRGRPADPGQGRARFPACHVLDTGGRRLGEHPRHLCVMPSWACPGGRGRWRPWDPRKRVSCASCTAATARAIAYAQPDLFAYPDRFDWPGSECVPGRQGQGQQGQQG